MNIKELLIEETLPKKSLFNINEVSSLLKVKPHEIRYWESEFPQIRSQKNKHNQRLYRKEDVILFSAIKHLLHEKKFTIAGALKVLSDSDILEQKIAKQEQAQEQDILESLSQMLPEPDKAFDEVTHEIYQECAQDLEHIEINVEAKHVGEMIADGLQQHAQQEQAKSGLSKLEYERKLALLVASKTQLNDLLVMLDKFSPTDFWGDSKDKKY